MNNSSAAASLTSRFSPNHLLKNKGLQAAVIAFTAMMLTKALEQTPMIERMELATWDWRVQKLASSSPYSKRIHLILIDQKSLDWGAQENGLSWPWPRQAYVPMLNFFQRADADAIVFDMIFSEQSQYGMDDDRLFSQALTTSKNTIGALVLGNSHPSNQQPTPVLAPDIRAKIQPASVTTFDVPAPQSIYHSLNLPVPIIANSFDRLGNVSSSPEIDSIFRRITPWQQAIQIKIPSIGIAAWQQITDTDMQRELNLHVDHHNRLVLNFRDLNNSYSSISAAAVIQSELQLLEGAKPTLNPDQFRNGIIFIATSAPGLKDLGATPMSPTSPRVLIHATTLDNALSNDFIVPLNEPLKWLLLIAFTTSISFLCRYSQLAWQSLALFLGFGTASVALGFLAYKTLYWVPIAANLTAISIAWVLANALNYSMEGRRRRFIKRAFSQYLSPIVIESVIANPEKLTLGGETKHLTIFFSDVQGFTGIAETLNPQQLTALLNDYLCLMTDIILDEGGTIDKYEGDAIIAFWNAPLNQPDHAERGVRAMLRCQTAIEQNRHRWQSEYGPEIHARVGVNSGPVVVGNMGSKKRFDYTFLGDAGNLASRLEGVNKVFGTFLLISEFTRQQLSQDIPVREIGRVIVVGRKAPVTVFEPMTEAAYQTLTAILPGFDNALRLFYEGKIKEAERLFAQLADTDCVSRAYLNRCQAMQGITDATSDTSTHKNPANWNGAWELTSK